MGPGESVGRASGPGREAVERLAEDLARASRRRAEESADGHQETGLPPKDGLLGEGAGVSAMDSPGLESAGGTRGVGFGRGDAEGQRGAIEVGTDQATAGGGAQELGQEQGGARKGRGAMNRRTVGITYLRSSIIRSDTAGEFPQAAARLEPR